MPRPRRLPRKNRSWPTSGQKENPSEPGLAGLHLENYTLPGLDLLDVHNDSDRTPLDRDELLTIQGLIIEHSPSSGSRPLRHDHEGTDDHPLRGVSGCGGACGQDRVARARHSARDTGRADQHPRPDSRQGHRRYRNRQLEEGEGHAARTFREGRLEGYELEAPTWLLAWTSTGIRSSAIWPRCLIALVAGTTGSGKSVCINSIIASLLFRYSPEQLRFIMIDPKVVEMQIYNKLPHLVHPGGHGPQEGSPRAPLARRRDGAPLQNLRQMRGEKYRDVQRPPAAEIAEGTRRRGGREERSRSRRAAEDDATPEDPDGPDEEMPVVRVPRADDIIVPDRMPFIVVIIDELADLMQTAPADVESAIARITQMARAGRYPHDRRHHRRRAPDVVTGIIKANIPSADRLPGRLKINSRVILDENGARSFSARATCS